MCVHSGTAPFSAGAYSSGMELAAIVADSEAALRWRNWQARGAESDRRTAIRMRGLMILIAAAFLGWFVVRLA